MIHVTPQGKPADAGKQRHLVVTGWDHSGTPLPVLVAEALDAAGIDADVSVARLSPPRSNAEGRAFHHSKSVRQPPPPPPPPVYEPGDIVRRTRTDVGKRAVILRRRDHGIRTWDLIELEDGEYTRKGRTGWWHEDYFEHDTSEDSTEVKTQGPLQRGSRVRRIAGRRTGDGGNGWQYETGAVGTVVQVPRNGDLDVRVDGDDRMTTGDFISTWAAGTFEVIG